MTWVLFNTLFIKLLTQIVFWGKLLLTLAPLLLLLTVVIVGVGATVATLTILVWSSPDSRGIEIVYG